MATPQLIELIKILRERTGAGMMDCKKALLENDMDLGRAGDYLREKGIAKAAKKAGNKDLAADLSAQAKKLTSETESMMTDWVRGAQYKGNTEFFQ